MVAIVSVRKVSSSVPSPMVMRIAMTAEEDYSVCQIPTDALVRQATKDCSATQVRSKHYF